MLVELSNSPRPYPWGDTFSIAQWQGREPGATEAELWFGTHPGSEAHVIEGGREVPLSRWLGDHGHPQSLPFLVKVLAAAMPLSIQVHPSLQRAQAGFAQENQAGVSQDSPERNYTDASDKPEIMIAWSHRFVALVGFQTPEAMGATLVALTGIVSDEAPLAPLAWALEDGVSAVIDWCFSGDEAVGRLAWALTEATRGLGSADEERAPELVQVLRRVVEHFPGDPGIVVACCMNLVTLERGQALFVPAGVVHAYLEGCGLEVMAPSDNVLRGGLTSKHVDLAELSEVVSKVAGNSAVCEPQPLKGGGALFAPKGVGFQVTHVELEDSAAGVLWPDAAMGPRVIVVESGQVVLTLGAQANILEGGHAYLAVLSGADGAELSGTGSVYVIGAA